jgi:pimeloyl-ACP methyl ester carboxylesterase
MEVESLRVAVEPGVALHVRRWPGDPDRVPFLLVHGLSSNARLWDGVARRLSAAGHRSFAVDLRSHGESDQPGDGYDTATAAADLDRLCAALDLPPAVVAGQSWGGNVVVQLAARSPGRAGALALLDGGWIDLRSSFASWRACAAALRPPDLAGLHVDQLRERLAKGHPDWAPWAVEATIANLRVLPDGRLERRLPIPRHMEIVRSMWDDPPAAYHPSIDVPVLLMPAGGKRNAAALAAAASAIPEAKLREYPGADHDLHAQRPDEVADDLLGLV